MSPLDIARDIVGRRHRITRDDMVAILSELAREGLDLRNSYVAGTLAEAPGDQARAWGRMCRDITVISVGPGLRDGWVRYDEPGSMHPMQRAELLFAAEALERLEFDQIGQLRRHARRVLIVKGEPEPPPRHVYGHDPDAGF